MLDDVYRRHLELFPYPLSLFLRCEEYIQREHEPHGFINPRRRERKGGEWEGRGRREQRGEERLRKKSW